MRQGLEGALVPWPWGPQPERPGPALRPGGVNETQAAGPPHPSAGLRACRGESAPADSPGERTGFQKRFAERLKTTFN